MFSEDLIIQNSFSSNNSLKFQSYSIDLKIIGEDFTDYNKVAVKLKGVLFDKKEFWMIRSSGNTRVR